MKIRAIAPRDLDAWVALRAALWPEDDPADLREDAESAIAGEGWRAEVLVAEEEGRLIGVVELSLRGYAEGCDSNPVPFIEGWFVAKDRRGRGIGRALIEAAEHWARTRGYVEIASDTQLWNTASQAAHKRLGFEEVERIVAFRKSL